jgi:hypothetical protein
MDEEYHYIFFHGALFVPPFRDTGSIVAPRTGRCAMFPPENPVHGHVIVELNEYAYRVSKHHHTYYLEGEKAMVWKHCYDIAEQNGLLSTFLDRVMVDIGELPM